MSSFIVIFLSLGLGGLLRKTGALPSGTHRVLNAVVVYVSLPALTLLHLHQLPLEARALYPALMAWILFIAGCAFLFAFGRWRGWSLRTIGAVTLTGALANTSFVGFPMLEALFGKQALGIGVLTDQLGSFLVLSSLGLVVASYCAARGVSWKYTLEKILRFPAFYAMLAALAFNRADYPVTLVRVLETFAGILVPLALLSIGFQLQISGNLIRRYAPQLACGLGFKLILGPAFIAALYLGLFGARGEDISITIVQAAMPPMIMGAVLASEYDLEPALANLMAGLGIPVAFLTVPAWFWLLRAL